MDIFTMTIIVSLAVVAIIYMQIQKITQNIDASGVVANNSPENLRQISVDKYKKFCELINNELRELKNMALYDDALKSDDLKDKFLESLSEMSKKLTFIETMNANKDSEKWEAELFEILNKLDTLIDENLKDSERINDEIRDRLKSEFDRI
ncbi:hypothetical protein [Campylobacter sp. RM16192]|uniref:hypothetical protein n=1 Tax=Campylobacter sp. RM16192 TaxID=1660080 RepID=UPI0014525764|nr:hypothetical protein [Campylobacter sp. RM16192]QCD52457.1 putative membrane protein [Campylobacter sp. RM16192]